MKAPLLQSERSRLSNFAKDVAGTAKLKVIETSPYEVKIESEAAQLHFELGCWLHFYRFQIGMVGKDGLKARIDCAKRIFLAGYQNPHYDFFTVFDFGERQFDTLFEMGDAELVLEGLRIEASKDRSGQIAAAFHYFGWSLICEHREKSLCV